MQSSCVLRDAQLSWRWTLTCGCVIVLLTQEAHAASVFHVLLGCHYVTDPSAIQVVALNLQLPPWSWV